MLIEEMTLDKLLDLNEQIIELAYQQRQEQSKAYKHS